MKTLYKKLLFLILILPFGVLAQNNLEGTVLDLKTKNPIIGVNVSVQGTTNGTSTDIDGKFKLPNLKIGEKIVFSFLGYKSYILTYDNQKQIAINLEEESNQLQEVVVQIGYGSAKKKDATGSVEVIGSKDFNKGAIVSTDQLLAGKAAGVRITNFGGAPDQKPQIVIRGGASLVASNDPLIIIDGVPISDTGTNPWNLINPNDVDSFSILKDASATAIYGVRASNGVILITTKKGTSGAPQFNYSSNISVGKITDALDVMNGTDYVKFIQQYHPDRTNSLGIDDPSTELVDNLSTPEIEGRILSNTNWQNQIFRTSITSDHNFSARANLYKKIPFRASIGYTDAQGLIKNNDYKRFTYSFKMTPKFLNDNLKVDVNAKGIYSYKNGGNEGAIGAALSMDPTKPVYGPSYNNKFAGYYQATEVSGNRDITLGARNPVAILEQRNGIDRALRFLGNIEFDYKLPFLRDLRAVANFGLDATESSFKETYSDNALATYTFNQGTDPTTNYLFNPGLAFSNNNTETNTTMDTYLVYSKSLSGFVRKVDGQAGYSYQNFKFDGNSLNFQNNPNTGIREPNINPNNLNNRYYSPLNLQAFFARGNVDILDKYLFTATFRADASSLFTADKRWGYFPAVGLAWKLIEENFMKNSKFVQDLKVRVGWGKTGQANFANSVPGGYFPSRELYSLAGANNQYLPGTNIYNKLPYNPDLTWEKTTTLNLGVDFEFFNKRIISGSIDVYTRQTTDLLAVVPSAPGQGTGATQNIKNSGTIDGEGFESSINIKVVQSEDFNLTIGGNIGYNINTVVDLGGLLINGAAGQSSNYSRYDVVGRQRAEALVYKQIYDTTGQPIIGAYEDLNKDGKITLDDRYLRPTVPNWTYGFNTSIQYKNWNLTANFRGQLDGETYLGNIRSRGFIEAAAPPSQPSTLNNVLNFYNGSASPLFQNFTASETEQSDYFLRNAAFLRCENITLAHTFGRFIGKSSLKLSGSINNAFLVTKFPGQDPESQGAYDSNLYPRPRTYTFGVSLDF